MSWAKPPGFTFAIHARTLSLLGAFDDAFLRHIANRYADPIRMCALAELERRRVMELDP